MRFPPSGLSTRNIGAPHGKRDSRMKPFCSSSCTGITPAFSPPFASRRSSTNSTKMRRFHESNPACFSVSGVGRTARAAEEDKVPVTAFESDTQRQLFLMRLSFATQVLIINWHWPYLRRWDNLRVTLLTSLSLIHVTVLLGVQTRGSQTGWFISLCVLFSVVCLIIAGRRKIFRGLYTCLCPTRLRLLDDEDDKAQRAADAKTRALEGEDDLEDSGVARKPVKLLTLAPIAEDDALSRQSSVEMQRINSADIEAREAAARAAAEKAAQDEADAAAAAAAAAEAAAAEAAAAEAAAAAVVVHPDPEPPEPTTGPRRRGLMVPATLPPPKPTAEALHSAFDEDDTEPIVEPPPSGLASPPSMHARHKSFMTLALLNREPEQSGESDDGEGERESSKEPGAESAPSEPEPASSVDEPMPLPAPVDSPAIPSPTALKPRLPALPRMVSAT